MCTSTTRRAVVSGTHHRYHDHRYYDHHRNHGNDHRHGHGHYGKGEPLYLCCLILGGTSVRDHPAFA